MKHRPVMLGAVLLMVVAAMARSQGEREALSVQGYPGQASVTRYQGRVFVDAQALSQITNGSLSFEKNRIILTLPGPDGSSSSDKAHTSGFSRPFMKAAIEGMASSREWGGTLQAVVHGYPVGNTTDLSMSEGQFNNDFEAQKDHPLRQVSGADVRQRQLPG